MSGLTLPWYFLLFVGIVAFALGGCRALLAVARLDPLLTRFSGLYRAFGIVVLVLWMLSVAGYVAFVLFALPGVNTIQIATLWLVFGASLPLLLVDSSKKGLRGRYLLALGWMSFMVMFAVVSMAIVLLGGRVTPQITEVVRILSSILIYLLLLCITSLWILDMLHLLGRKGRSSC